MTRTYPASGSFSPEQKAIYEIVLAAQNDRNEPGIYVRKDDIVSSEVFRMLPAAEQQTIRAALDRYDGIGVRIEDDVLITSGEPKILSAGAPRTVRDIEAWMASKR